MRAILISEKRLDDLVSTMLAEMERDANAYPAIKDDLAEPSVSFRRVNYDVRVLVGEIKKGEMP